MPQQRKFDASQRGAPSAWMQRLKPLAIVLLAVAIAMLLRWPLDRFWAGLFPFVTFFPAVLVVAMFCGWRYGMLAAVLSSLAIYVWREPGTDNLLLASSIFIFLLANAVTVGLAEFARRARSRAEAEATAAHESEHRFNVMADSVPLLIWVHDAAGKILFVNRRWEEFFGITQESARRVRLAGGAARRGSRCLHRIVAQGDAWQARVPGDGARASGRRRVALDRVPWRAPIRSERRAARRSRARATT